MGYIGSPKQCESSEVIYPERKFVYMLCSVVARHSNPHWAARRPNAECPTFGDQSLPFRDRFLALSYGLTFSLYYDCYLFPYLLGITPMANSACLICTFNIESSNTRSLSYLAIVILDRRTLQWCDICFLLFPFESTGSWQPNLVTCATFASTTLTIANRKSKLLLYFFYIKRAGVLSEFDGRLDWRVSSLAQLTVV